MNPLSMMAQQPKIKSVSDIINNHLAKNDVPMSHDDLMVAMSNAVKQGFQLVRFNNVLFAAKKQNENVLFSIVNGDSPKNYIKAIRMFIAHFKRQGCTHFMIYVQDKISSEKIGNSVGLQNITFTHSKPGGVDPYLMVGEA